MRKRLPNVVELGRKPDIPRYVWILESTTGVNSGASWEGLHKALKCKTVERLLFVDLFIAHVYEVAQSAEDFLSIWRAHYFDPEWDYGNVPEKA